MANFKFFNPHPHGLLGCPDCVKRAICVCTGMDYMEVQRGLNRQKRISKVKIYYVYPNPVQYIEKLGAKSISLPQARMTAAELVDFVASIQENASLIIGTKGHWMGAVIRDGTGTVMDTGNRMNELVTEAWIFRKE